MMVSRRTYAGRAVGVVLKHAAGAGQRLNDHFKGTYLQGAAADAGWCSYFRPLPAALPATSKRVIAALSANYLAHRFDLLGSGWVRVRHGMVCRGVEGWRYEGGPAVEPDREGRWLQGRINRSNLAESQRIWKMVDASYVPIDWQRDFKSGYRWAEDTWYLDIRYGHKPGVDIKVPWELARMQHLPRLALAYALAKNEVQGLASANRYVSEFRNQVLDFIATNPPRFGVNWRSAMEVAIRAANWAVAADLFRASGAKFDEAFEDILARSLYEHGLHIECNLEWDPEVRGNHYLANVAGLLFIAAYLPRTPKTDAWLAFAVRELVNEADFQFAPDGTHREASTAYHCLTAEMMAYATGLVLALPGHKRQALAEYDHRQMPSRPPLVPAPVQLYPSGRGGQLTPFPGWYFQRLERMGEFVAHITKPDGRVPQVGDNDSGRFLRFDASFSELKVGQARARYDNLAGYDELPDDASYWDEDHLDHRGLLAAMGALFARADLLSAAGEGCLEAEIMRGLLGGAGTVPSWRQRNTAARGAEAVSVGAEDQLHAPRKELDAFGGARCYEIVTGPAGGDLRDGLACYGYPDFGLYVLRSKRLYLAIRCGGFGLVGNGGHAHHDQLSIELSLDGRNLIVDPGTYLYSALPHRRNEYRHEHAHFAPHPQRHQAQGTGPGLFQMRDRAVARCLYFGPRGFAGCHRAFGPAVYRVIEIEPSAIRITDRVERGDRLRHLTPAWGWRCGWRESPRQSPGYGIVARDADSITA